MAGYFVLHTRWHTLDRLKEYQAVVGIRLESSDGIGRFVTNDAPRSS